MNTDVPQYKRYVLGEFKEAELLCGAARKLREQGVASLDAYSPYPIHGIEDALALPRSPVPKVALAGGLLGACGGYLMQWWMNGVNYEINVANRPPHGFWTNIPITFESGVLLAVLSIFFSSIFHFFGLPKTYHPVFESEQFRTATVDAYWLSAELDDPAQVEALEEKMRASGAQRVHTILESA